VTSNVAVIRVGANAMKPSRCISDARRHKRTEKLCVLLSITSLRPYGNPACRQPEPSAKSSEREPANMVPGSAISHMADGGFGAWREIVAARVRGGFE
jgi:hypothetical protein